MAEGISVIVCCYNSEERLPKTIEYLVNQETRRDFKWEIVIINNNSNDKTREVAQELLSDNSNRQIDYKIIDEKQPGLTYARECGISNSQYKYLIFCDDDNWLDAHYVQRMYDFFMEENAAAIGGLGEATADIQLPDWFKEKARFYAVGEQAKTGHSKEIVCLYGAGMGVNKEVYLDVRQRFMPILSDRTGENLSSGGDTEMCFALKLAGYDLLYSDKLRFHHFIANQRLTNEYCDKLERGIAKSSQLIEHYFLFFPYIRSRNASFIALLDLTRLIAFKLKLKKYSTETHHFILVRFAVKSKISYFLPRKYKELYNLLHFRKK